MSVAEYMQRMGLRPQGNRQQGGQPIRYAVQNEGLHNWMQLMLAHSGMGRMFQVPQRNTVNETALYRSAQGGEPDAMQALVRSVLKRGLHRQRFDMGDDESLQGMLQGLSEKRRLPADDPRVETFTPRGVLLPGDQTSGQIADEEARKRVETNMTHGMNDVMRDFIHRAYQENPEHGFHLLNLLSHARNTGSLPHMVALSNLLNGVQSQHIQTLQENNARSHIEEGAWEGLEEQLHHREHLGRQMHNAHNAMQTDYRPGGSVPEDYYSLYRRGLRVRY